MISADKGWTKPKSHSREETTDNSELKIFQRLQAIDPGDDMEKEKNSFRQIKTAFNIDDECGMNEEDGTEYDPLRPQLFKSKEYHNYFVNYFNETCVGETNCEIEIMEPKARVGEPDDFDKDNFAGGLDFVNMLSDGCLKRIKWIEETS